ncbi:MAG: DUF3656 domain-containing protein [Saprospiraceae bacterium]
MNIIVNDIVVPNELKMLPIGTEIYRNHDAEFNRMLENEHSAVRKIGVVMHLSETPEGFQLLVTDEDGHVSTALLETTKERAKHTEGLMENIVKNLSKTGNTPFVADDVVVEFSQDWFLPSSKINEIRRQALEELVEVRIREYEREEIPVQKTDHPYPVQQLDFTYNVSNKKARAFYHRHGVTDIEKAFELQWDPGKSRVMVTKYCVKYELGKCPATSAAPWGKNWPNPDAKAW